MLLNLPVYALCEAQDAASETWLAIQVAVDRLRHLLVGNVHEHGSGDKVPDGFVKGLVQWHGLKV